MERVKYSVLHILEFFSETKPRFKAYEDGFNFTLDNRMQHFKEQRVRIVEDFNSNYLLPSGTIVPHVEDFDKLEVNPSSSTRTAVMVD